MSKIAFCKRGGMEGILTTKAEMHKLAVKLERKFADEITPLPNLSIAEQKQKIESCVEHSSARYWETETGSHGWCCKNCGTVIQWG